MPQLKRTALADIVARHDLSTRDGYLGCLEEAVAAYDQEVLDEPRDSVSGEELSPEPPTGDDYNEILSLLAHLNSLARKTT